MSKDPAVLFYTADFIIGTEFFNDDQVGKYIRALCKQHQHGHLSLDQLNQITNNDTYVLSKFKKDRNGLYYNERMDIETNRRKNYADSRRKNIMKRYHKTDKPLTNKRVEHSTYVDTHVLHMENENENENKDININPKEGMQGGKESKKFIPPDFEEFEKYCADNKHKNIARRAYDGYAAANWHDSQGKPIRSWKQKLQHVWFREENKDPPSEEDERRAIEERQRKKREAGEL